MRTIAITLCLLVSFCSALRLSRKADPPEPKHLFGEEESTIVENGKSIRHLSMVLRGDRKDLKPSSKDAFQQENKCETEPTLEKAFAALDAALDSQGIKLDANLMQQALTEPGHVVFSIRDNLVSYKLAEGSRAFDYVHKHARDYALLLQGLAKNVELPNMDFALIPSEVDGEYPADPRKFPGTMRPEGTVGEDLLIVPRSLLATSKDSWRNHLNNPDENAVACPSDNAKPSSFAVFRGSSTGDQYTWNDKLADHPLIGRDGAVIPRFLVAKLSQKRPDLLDGGFTKILQTADNSSDKFEQFHSALMKNQLKDAEQMCYSAIVIADGNVVPDRFAKQLTYGKPIVFVHNQTKAGDEFWYPELVAWKHYVPAMMTNEKETLTAALEHLKQNPGLLQEIGKGGHDFVKDHLSDRRLNCYLVQLLQGYAQRSHLGV